MEGTLRFVVSTDGHKAYKSLCGADALFPQMSDMFFWCVILGYKSGQDRRKISKTQGVFTWSAFDDIQKTALTAIAIESFGDFSILGPPVMQEKEKAESEQYEDFRRTLEEYAEIGLTILLNMIKDEKDKYESNYQILRAYIIENTSKKEKATKIKN